MRLPVYTALIPAEKHEEHSHKDELLEKGFISSTASVDSAFSLFKRGIVGSYHKMSKDHLDSYLQEFCWRFNRRHMQPEMFDALLHEVATKKPTDIQEVDSGDILTNNFKLNGKLAVILGSQ
jgi:ISXO2-like transposase domain